jgi:hypothetical protein
MTITHTTRWSYEYLPFTGTDPDGSEHDIPNYRINSYEDLEGYVAETDENLPDEIQLEHAQLIAAAPHLLDALQYFFNIMHDYASSSRKGYVKHALDKARAAIHQATRE